MLLSLRAGFQNGYINLLKSDTDIDDNISDIFKGYAKLSEQRKIELRVPYRQTSALIEEMINLEYTLLNNLVNLNINLVIGITIHLSKKPIIDDNIFLNRFCFIRYILLI